MMANLIGYGANVAKSVIYATNSYVSENMSSVNDFKETNSDLFKTAYSDIINYKQTYKRMVNYTKKSQVYQAGEQLKKSLMEDLKNGTFYNNNRLDQISSEQAGMGFDDFGGDGGFEGLDNFNFDDEDFNDTGSNEAKSASIISANINQSSEANANAIGMAIVRSTEYSAQVSRENTNLLYVQNSKSNQLLGRHLGVINDNIGSMMPIVDISKQMLENQGKYFTDSMRQLQDQTALLREISTKMTTMMGPEKKEDKRKKTYSDIAIGGIPDIKEYFSRVKDNVMNNPDLGLITSTLNSMGDDTNVLKMLAANPYGMLMEAMVGKFLIGKNLKKSMGKLDKTASSLFGSLTAKLNGFTDEDRSDNPFTDKIRQLLKIFSPDTGLKSGISTAKYYKGDMKWNGISHKTLNEVIPQQLSKIISLLSGLPAQIYDSEKGVFVDQSSLKKEFDNLKQGYANSATRDIETEMKDLSKYINMSYSEQQSLFKDMKSMLNTIYDKGILFEYNNKNLDHSYYNISDSDNYEIIKGLFESTNKDTQKMLSQNIMRNRADQKTYLTEMENKGNSIYNAIENKLFGKDDYRVDERGNVKKNSTLFFKNSPLNVKSEKGYNGFWYLDQILRELRFIRDNNTATNGGGGGRRGRNRRTGSQPPDISRYDIESNHSVSREETREIEQRNRNEREYETGRNRVRERHGDLLEISEYEPEVLRSRTSGFLNNIKESEEFRRNSLSQNRKSFMQDMMNELDETGASYDKIKSITNKIKSVVDKPNQIMSKVFDKIDDKLYSLIYGTGEKADDRSFVTVMIEKLKENFNTFSTWLDERIIDPMTDKIKSWGIKDKTDAILEKTGLKDLGGKLKEYLFGNKETGVDGLFSEIGRGIKSVFSGALNTTKNAFGTVFSPITSKFKNRFSHLGGPNYDGTGGPTEEFFSNTLKGNVTSGFGLRHGSGKIGKNHTGIDIGAAKGSFIKSPIGGIVSDNKRSKDSNGFGNMLSINDDFGAQHYFGHMNSTSKLKPGTRIRPGQNIGNIGSTGNSTGPHLHYETRMNGKPINPDTYYDGIGGSSNTVTKEDGDQYNNLAQFMNTYTKDLNSGKGKDKIANRLFMKLNNILKQEDMGTYEYVQLKKDIMNNIVNNKKVLDGINNKSDHYKIIEAVSQEMRNPTNQSDNNPLVKFFTDVKGEINSAVGKVYSGFTNGDNVPTRENLENDKKKVANYISEASKGITTYAPEAIGSALLGSGVSLITGMMGGPLLGAAIGAGVSITKHSEKIQNWLFGEEFTDENGDKQRKGGFLGKATSTKFVNKMKRLLPDLKNYGIVGGVTGLIPFMPFGPITGVMMGASFAYAKDTGKMKEWLFGENNETWLGKKKEKLKTMLPRVGAGALLAAVASPLPFGIVGNAFLGSAIGMASTSEKFQNFIFGKPDGHGKYIGGLVPHFKEKIIDPMTVFLKDKRDKAADWFKSHVFKPLASSVKPFGKQLEVMAKGLGKGIIGIFDRIVERSLGVPLTKLIAQIAAPVGKTLTKVAGGIGKVVFGVPIAAIGKMGNSLRKHQIKKGTADYMTAQERIDFRRKNFMGVGDEMSEFDQLINGFANGDSKKLGTLRDTFSNIKTDYRKNKSEKAYKIDEMGGVVSKDLGYFTSRKIMALIKAGKSEEALKIIDNTKQLQDGEKEILKRSLSTRISSYNDELKTGYEQSASYKDLMKKLKASGVKIPKRLLKDPEKLSKYIDLTDKEINTLKKKNDNKTPEERMEESQERESERTQTFRDKINERMENITALLQDIAHPSPDSDKFSDAINGYNENSKNKKKVFKDNNNRLYHINTRGEKEYISEEEDVHNDESYDTSEIRKRPNIITASSNIKATRNKLQRDEDGREYHIDNNNNKIYNKGDKQTQEVEKEQKAEKVYKNKMLGFLAGKVEKVRGKAANFIENNIDQKGAGIGGLITKGMLAFAFAPQLIGFAKSTVLPWIKDKVVPFITGTVIPSIVDGIGYVVKEGLLGIGGFILDGFKGFLTGFYNSTLAHLPGLSPITTSNNSSSSNDKVNSNNKTPNTITNNSGGLISNSFIGETHTDAETGEKYNEVGNGQKAIARYIITGGRTGTGALKVAGKVANVGAKVVGKGFDIAKYIRHPIKSILGKTTPSKLGNLARGAGSLSVKATNLIDKSAGFMNKAYKGFGADKALTTTIQSIKNFFFKLFSNPQVEAIIGSDKVARILEKFVPKFLKELGEKLAVNIAKVSARLAGLSTGGILNIALAVIDFGMGYADAQAILGITDEPSFLERVGCGLMKALTGLTIVLAFLPDSFLVDLIFDTLLPIFGVENTELQKQREKANKEWEDYKKKNNSDISMEDYIKQNKGNSNKYTVKSFTNTNIDKYQEYFNQADDATKKKMLSPWNMNPWENTSPGVVDYLNIGKNKPNNPTIQSSSNSTSDSTSSTSTSTPSPTPTITPTSNLPYQNVGGEYPTKKGLFTGIGGEASADGINKILRGKLSGMGQTYMDLGKKYGVDPALAASIMINETGGNSSALTNDNNPAGIMDWNNNWKTIKHFDSLNDGLDYAVKNMYDNYISKGLTSIDQIGAKYAPIGAANDPNGQNSNWVPTVKSLYKQITGDESPNSSTPSGNGTSSDSTSTSGGGIMNFFSSLTEAVGSSINGIFGFNKTSNGTGSSGVGKYAGDMPSSEDGKKILNIAQSFLGDPYVWGGTGSPLTESVVNSFRGTDHDISKGDWQSWLGKPGYDCSGFVQAVYSQMGIQLPRSTYEQVNCGEEVSQNSLAAGDLVFFGSKSAPHHVGIYLGSGQFIEAPSSGKCVKISNLTDRNDFCTARRIVGTASDPREVKSGGLKYRGIGGPIENFFTNSLKGNVTSGFGLRNTIGTIPQNHTGIDIGAAKGSSIKSPIAGTVVNNKPTSDSNGLGNLLVVKDGIGGEHYFGHMENQSNLKPGDKINAGQNIGNIGSTGNSTGPHLHYETRMNGVPVNPESYRRTYEINQNNGMGGEYEDTSDDTSLNTSSVSNSDIGGFLQSIVTILTKICSNTDQVNTIVSLLSDSSDSGNSNTGNNNVRESKKQKLLNKIQKSTENNEDISYAEIAKEMESLALGN